MILLRRERGNEKVRLEFKVQLKYNLKHNDTDVFKEMTLGIVEMTWFWGLKVSG